MGDIIDFPEVPKKDNPYPEDHLGKVIPFPERSKEGEAVTASKMAGYAEFHLNEEWLKVLIFAKAFGLETLVIPAKSLTSPEKEPA